MNSLPTIGLPRGLLYYRYGDLWRDFLRRLGHPVMVSPKTTSLTLEQGRRDAIDESCLPFQIYLGQVHALLGRCDALLVPHVERLEQNAEVCMRFHGLYDIVQNTYRDAPLLSYDMGGGVMPELMAFLRLGRALGHRWDQSHRAYLYAKTLHRLRRKKLSARQNRRLQSGEATSPKILILSQRYLIHDALMGECIKRTLGELGATIIFADYFDAATCSKMSQQLSGGLYWAFSKELVGALALTRNLVDGVITVTAFPCGADALVNELLLRSVKSPPMINLVLDDLQGEGGIETRLESFLDMIKGNTAPTTAIPSSIERRNTHVPQKDHQLSAARELSHPHHISASKTIPER